MATSPSAAGPHGSLAMSAGAPPWAASATDEGTGTPSSWAASQGGDASTAARAQAVPGTARKLEPSLGDLSLVDPPRLPGGPASSAPAVTSSSAGAVPFLVGPPPVPRRKPSAEAPLHRATLPSLGPPSQSRMLAAVHAPGRMRPAPLALPTGSTSPSRQLHMSPSAPDMRQAPATASHYLPSNWGGLTEEPGAVGGAKAKAGGRNAKGLSLALGRDSPSASSSTSSSDHSLSPLPTSALPRPPPLRPVNRSGSLHTSIPHMPSSAGHSQFYAQQRHASTSSVTSKGPSLMTLITTSEMRDPTDGPSSSQHDSRPYVDGPVEVLPNLWIGCDENARDWQNLSQRLGVRRVLNVAKELVGVLDDEVPAPEEQQPKPALPPPAPPSSSSLRPGWPSPERALRNTVSTPDLRDAPPPVAGGTINGIPVTEKRYHLPNGKTLDYLHLPWSHGQADLVSGGEDGQAGFVRAGEWAKAGMDSNHGVLVHCQCGISRSATLVISIVMQLAAEGKLPQILGEVRGMHDAYEFVKARSPWIGPNVSLIYQLLEWERLLAARLAEEDKAAGVDRRSSPRQGFASDSVESEEEWSLRRAELEAQEEAEQMDRDMVERLRRTKGDAAPAPSSGPSSRSSSFSSTGLVPPPKGSWRIKRRLSRSSLASVTTLEEDEGRDERDDDAGFNDSQRVKSWAEAGGGGTAGPLPRRSPSGSDDVPTPSRTSPVGSLPEDGDHRRERQRSSTLSFVPSLATLPSSPIQGANGTAAQAAQGSAGRLYKPLLAGRPRSRTQSSSSPPSETPQEARPPFQFPPPPDEAQSSATPTVDGGGAAARGGSDTPSAVPSTIRRFGSHQSPKQRRDAHRRSFSVDPLPSPLRSSPHANGHRRSNLSVSHATPGAALASGSGILPAPGGLHASTVTSDLHVLATLAHPASSRSP